MFCNYSKSFICNSIEKSDCTIQPNLLFSDLPTLTAKEDSASANPVNQKGEKFKLSDCLLSTIFFTAVLRGELNFE
jgi:hypothetical protein